jgi:8-oxo-dGTP diphosphatase
MGTSLCTKAVGLSHCQHVRVGVQILVLSGSRVLFVRRACGYGRGTWSLPGGHLELNETIAECAERELLEETGLIAEELTLVAVSDPRADANNHMQVCMNAVTWSGRPRVNDPVEVDDIGFYHVEDVVDNLFQPSRDLISKICGHRIY